MEHPQDEVIAFLSARDTHGGCAVERIDTHASALFLAGDRAWKLKRAVRYDYLDYSTPDRRRDMCAAEFELGRRLAPTLYIRVVAVNRRADGSLSIGGAGHPLDWLIEMARFDQDRLFNRLAHRHALEVSLMPALARSVASQHETAARVSARGDHAGMEWVIEGNAASFAHEAAGVLDSQSVLAVTTALRETNDRLHAHLDARRNAGFVRRCHGDLHLGNVVLLDQGPTLFDPVEFNDAIACIDVMYDIAFLLMDLERLSLRAHANALLNGYLGATNDIGGLCALPLFLACRAGVRAKVRATAAALQRDEGHKEAEVSAARQYLDLAWRLIHPPPPVLIAIGGLSGSGKSLLARGLAPHIGPAPGAIVVRSDEVRKQMFGADPVAHLGSDAYTETVSARVYGMLADRVASIVRNRHGAIADAVFLSPEQRDAIERVATAADMTFVGLWLDAPTAVRIDRVTGRQGDASDATAEVVRAQRSQETSHIRWHRLDASTSPDRILDDARRVIAAVTSTAIPSRST